MRARTAGAQPPELLGRWRLQRRVADRRLGLSGRVVGELRLECDGSEIIWRESGLLSWNGAQVPVSRLLRLARDEDGWLVRFADGRPFHRWRPGQVVEHPCRDDVYRGVVDASPSRLRILWDVTGPAKDQRILTRCVRG
jgi:hypothetical protein